MTTLLNVIHIITAVLIVIVVLMQSGKGAEISATFGGSSQTVFGSSGGANFFTRLTFILAGVFMATSLTLTIIGAQSRKSVFEGQINPPSATTTKSAPAATTAAPTPDTAKATAPAQATTPAAAPNPKK